MDVSTRTEDSTVVLELVGSLRSEDVGMLRAVLGRAVTEAAGCVVCDLSRLTDATPGAVSIFASAQRPSGEPGPEVALAGAWGSVAETVRSVGLPGLMVAAGSVVEARELACGDGPDHAQHLRLSPTRFAPRSARQFVASRCLEWQLPQLTQDACVVVSELVTNAVEHAATDIAVRVEHRGDHLFLAVQDEMDLPFAWPVPADGRVPRQLPERGYGLRMVRRMATAVGVRSHPGGGKVVWAELSVPAPDLAWPSNGAGPVAAPATVSATMPLADAASGRRGSSRFVRRLHLHWTSALPDTVTLQLEALPPHPALAGGRWQVPYPVLRCGLKAPAAYDGMAIRPGAENVDDHDLTRVRVELPDGGRTCVLELASRRLRRFLDDVAAAYQGGPRQE